MKRITSLALIGFLYFFSTSFMVPEEEVFRGRLEVVGQCGQVVVSIISGNASKTGIEKQWRDPVTGKSFTYAFTVRNACDIRSLKVGDEFSFQFGKPRLTNPCNNCLLYRPVPVDNRAIKMVKADEQELQREI